MRRWFGVWVLLLAATLFGVIPFMTCMLDKYCR